MTDLTVEQLMPEATRLRYPVHEQIVRFALDELHRHVHEVPMGSNSGPRVREYQAATWLGGTGWPWCFPAGTMIDTPTGMTPIEDIAPGDWVLDHEGTPRRALASMVRLPEACVRVRGQGFDVVTTPEHPFRVRRQGWRRADGRLAALPSAVEEWVPAGEIRRGDWVCMPQLSTHATSAVTPEEAYVLGRYIADGWSVKTKRKNATTVRETSFICGAHAERGEIAAALDSAGFGYSVSERRTVTQFELRAAPGRTLRDAGSSALTKRVPGEVFGWDSDCRQAVLDGYADGDGSPYRDGAKASTVSRELAVGITRLARSLGYTTSFRIRQRAPFAVIEGRTIKQAEIIYDTAWSSRSTRTGMRFDEQGRAWATVKEASPASPREVFNLTVEDSHTYVADGIAVHNCVAYWQWCLKQAGFKMPYLGAGAYALGQWARDNHWSTTLAHAIPGDGLVIHEGAGHLAVYLSHTGSKVHTVNGNWGDAVALWDFDKSEIQTVVHIHEKGIVPRPKPPLWEVVTSASGHSKVVFVGTHSQLAKVLAALFNRYGGITIRRRKGGT